MRQSSFHTKNTKLKNSKTHYRRTAWNKGIPNTKESNLKNSLSHKGKIPWNKGRKASPEEVEKNRISHLGKKHSIETITKMKNIRNTPEYLTNQSKKLKGKPAWSKGKKGVYSEDTIKKMSSSRKGIPAWNKGVSPTEIQKQKQSAKMIGKMVGNKNPMYGIPPDWSGCGYYYESPLQGIVYLRSSYELAYAQYLDSIKELWVYELETFEIENSTYTPDFFLPCREKFIEIKGYLSSEAYIKISLFKEQYPFDLEVLFKEDLLKLGLKVK